ncbi:MAG: CvpA family protein [Pirellulales bacterium]
MYSAIYLATWFAGSSMMVREGLWSNAISLVNILISGLVAFGFYSPITVYLDEMLNGEYTYLLDFVVIWALFVITMLICRVLTGLASKTRMRFKHPIDPIGGPIVGELASWVLAAFVMATLHTSPMPKEAFGGRLVYTPAEVDSSFALFNPDLGWLRFVERVTKSDGFGRSGSKGFSAKAFVKIYAEHRDAFGKADAGWIRVRRS